VKIMGISPSREDFTTLEGYANQTDEARIDILTKAGITLESQDHEIGNFLGTNEVFGAFIRGIITKCLELKTQQINGEVNIYLESVKNENIKKLDEKTAEMNEILNNMAKKWEKKEEYYFRTTKPKDHLLITETNYIEEDDLEKFNENKNYISSWERSSSSMASSIISTESDVQGFSNNFDNRHKEFNLTSRRGEDVTMGSTNDKSRMQEKNKKGKNVIVTNQSFTMALENEIRMENMESPQVKESIHKPKGIKDIKVYAGLMAINQKKEDQKIIEVINEENILSYHINTLGKCMRNGNLYTYLSFYTEKERSDFCNNDKVRKVMGNCYKLNWLDALDKTVILSVRNINKEINEKKIKNKLEEKFGKITKIISKSESHDKISMKIEMKITCSEENLMNTWGIIVGNQMINVEPINYNNKEIKSRGEICATIIDIPKEIEESKFTDILKETGARYWYRVNDRNDEKKYRIVILFNNKNERKTAIENYKLEIEGNTFTWFFCDEDNHRNQFRNYNNRSQNNNNRQQQ
jgi:hypothetical protein